eukprot:m.26798 g.26798  ORF g.26798 m.26798 type:complete len:325 (+) comp9295_c0_seq1:36-1010(+)
MKETTPATTALPPWMKYGMGSLATMGASVFSNPMEVMKTRLQLQGEMQARGTYTTKYRNVFHAMKVVFKNEGVRGVQKGLVLGLWYQAAMNGTRLGIFDYIRDEYVKRGNQPKLLFNMATGAVSGGIGAFVASPFYLVKTQQQAQSSTNVAVGYQHKHTSSTGAFRQILREGGIRGLWRGASGSVPRLVAGSSVQLGTYNLCKDSLQDYFGLRDGILLHFLSAMYAGVFVSVAMNPFDVVATRLYNQPRDPATNRGLFYSGVVDCMKKTLSKEGFKGLYKGVTSNYARLGPHTVLCFVFLEQLKRLVTEDKDKVTVIASSQEDQ